MYINNYLSLLFFFTKKNERKESIKEKDNYDEIHIIYVSYRI